MQPLRPLCLCGCFPEQYLTTETQRTQRLHREECKLGHYLVACSVLVGSPMPDWNTDEIRAVHFRMHKAEGVLFQNALVRAAEVCKLNTFPVYEKELMTEASSQFGTRTDRFLKNIAALGKTVGPPWGKDQQDAALIALIALQNT